MKELKTSMMLIMIPIFAASCIYCTLTLIDISVNIERTTDYILSTQEIVSGQHNELKELRHITDEFRAQIKGLQKEVLIGIQEGGM